MWGSSGSDGGNSNSVSFLVVVVIVAEGQKTSRSKLCAACRKWQYVKCRTFNSQTFCGHHKIDDKQWSGFLYLPMRYNKRYCNKNKVERLFLDAQEDILTYHSLLVSFGCSSNFIPTSGDSFFLSCKSYLVEDLTNIYRVHYIQMGQGGGPAEKTLCSFDEKNSSAINMFGFLLGFA